MIISNSRGNYCTTQLLQNAADKLRLMRNVSTEIASPLLTMDWVKNLRDSFLILESRHELKPVTKLFAVVDICLRQMKFVPKHRNIGNSAIDFSYTGGIIMYKYNSFPVTTAVTHENTDGQATLFYLIFQFTEKPSAYRVIEIEKDLIPNYCSFQEDAVLAAKDDDIFRHLHILISNTISNFFQPVISGGFRSHEVSKHGVNPFFIQKKKRKRKKSKEDSDDEDDSAELVYKNAQYDYLLALYQDIGEKKPNASARLFAVIMEYLKINCRCSYTPSDTWPGGIEYNAKVELFFLSRANDGKDSKENQKKLYLMSIVILTDEIDYFVIFRFCDESARKITQKLIGKLVPTFDVSDIKNDLDRFDDIQHWLADVVGNFLIKVIDDTYHSSKSASYASGNLSKTDSPASRDEEVAGTSSFPIIENLSE